VTFRGHRRWQYQSVTFRKLFKAVAVRTLGTHELYITHMPAVQFAATSLSKSCGCWTG